jgi:hypothetical protein
VIAPGEAVQVTPALAESFATVAVKVCEAPPIRVTDVGEMETAIAGGAALPPQPERSAERVRAAKPADKRATRLNFDIGGVTSLSEKESGKEQLGPGIDGRNEAYRTKFRFAIQNFLCVIQTLFRRSTILPRIDCSQRVRPPFAPFAARMMAKPDVVVPHPQSLRNRQSIKP